jgi:hypothetical protein
LEYVFDPAVFDDAEFDAASFVAQTLAGGAVTLEKLGEDLGRFMRQLSAQLTDLKNSEYPDFIGLSSNLVGTTEALRSIGQHLKPIRDRVLALAAGVEGSMSELEALLAQRRLLVARVNALELVQDCARTAERARALVREAGFVDGDAAAGAPQHRRTDTSTTSTPDAADPAADFRAALLHELATQQAHAALDHRVLLVERASRQLAMLRALRRHAVSLELALPREADEADVAEALRRSVCAAFMQCLGEEGRGEALRVCVRASVVGGAGEALLRVFRDEVVRPELERELTAKRLEAAEQALLRKRDARADEGDVTGAGAGMRVEGVRSMLERALAAMRARVAEAVRAGGPSGDAFHVDFVTRGVWAEVAARLKQLQELLNTARPVVFHRTFTETAEFARESLRAMCADDEAARRLDDAVRAAMRDVWQLEKYRLSRLPQIARKLEQLLRDMPWEVALRQHQQGATGPVTPLQPVASDAPAASREWSECCERAWLYATVGWRPHVFLLDLAPHLLDFTVGALNAYADWVLADLGVADAAPPAAAAPVASASATSPASVSPRVAADDDAKESSPRPPGDGAAPPARRATPPPVALLLGLVDLHAVPRRVRDELVPFVADRCSPRAEFRARVTAAVEAAFAETPARYAAASARLRAHLARALAGDCMAPLQGVRAIKSVFTMTGAPWPTHASAYVAEVLAPLYRFLAEHASLIDRLRDPTFRDALCQDACDVVCEAFAREARALLEEVRKTEASLASLKRLTGKAGAQRTDDRAVIDAAKIRAQLQLDAAELRQRVVAAGGAARAIESVEDAIGEALAPATAT